MIKGEKGGKERAKEKKNEKWEREQRENEEEISIDKYGERDTVEPTKARDWREATTGTRVLQ